MAEAHAAVAFSFQVNHEGGFDFAVNHEALYAVWRSGVRSWKKRFGRMKNNFHNGVYPASPASFLLCLSVMIGMYYAGVDLSRGYVHSIAGICPEINVIEETACEVIALVLFTLVVWVAMILVLKYSLKALLCYTGWMYEPRGKMSLATRLWIGLFLVFKGLTKVLGGRRPLLYSYQGSLPKLPVPSLKGTMERYLRSVRPLMDDEKYRNIEKLVKEFETGIGKKLQRYLVLKSWWATNYVTDWWEEYVYLRGRSPIMVNSNFYGLDAILRQPTRIQAARAGNVINAMLTYRRSIDREEMKPILVNNTVPLCSWQYERQFNTTRVPGIETDKLVHLDDSTHVAVYNRGRWYKVYIHYKGKLLSAAQIEVMMQQILDDDTAPAQGEAELAALTAGDRIPWAKARQQYFSKGLNKTSLDVIEKSAFVVVLDDEPQDYDPNDPSKLDKFACSMLHGDCTNRWFDKSFCMVFCSNGRMGFNAEHSWADAPIMAHLYEHAMTGDLFGTGADAPVQAQLWENSFPIELQINGADAPLMAQLWENMVAVEFYHDGADAPVQAHLWEFTVGDDWLTKGADAPIMAHMWEIATHSEYLPGYKEDGHCRGDMAFQPPNPIKLQWEIPKECQNVIADSLAVARQLASSVDLHLIKHDAYGKGFMKTAKTSPDAYIQMALQLAYFRDAGHFSLTYEASMTRLYREGRTETVRSCTIESSAFVKAMDDPSKTKEECIALLKNATEQHQTGYRDAMTGKGIDRHLFCLYVVSKYLGIESPFLKEVLSEPWRLSTSQTPHQQTTKQDLVKHPELICAGGGFGPVADDGYGVSYVIAGEDIIFFHVSSKKTSPETDSPRFARGIERALADMRDLFTQS